MKRWLLVGSGVSAVALAAALILWPQEPVSKGKNEKEEAAKVASSPKKERPKKDVEEAEIPSLAESQAYIAKELEALLAEDTPLAWSKIPSLYSSASIEMKRKVLERATTFELGRSLLYVLETVGNDATPAQDDVMIVEAAELLKDRWETPADVVQGREMMLAQTTDKRQWVLARAMITFMKDTAPDSEFQFQKTKLQAKLVDMHSSVADGFIRSSLVDGMSELGEKDVAMVMAKGRDVAVEELEIVKAERAAQDEALKQLEAEADSQ
jgi:hypothetical protein